MRHCFSVTAAGFVVKLLRLRVPQAPAFTIHALSCNPPMHPISRISQQSGETVRNHQSLLKFLAHGFHSRNNPYVKRLTPWPGRLAKISS
jgi:hypothetical protein